MTQMTHPFKIGSLYRIYHDSAFFEKPERHKKLPDFAKQPGIFYWRTYRAELHITGELILFLGEEKILADDLLGYKAETNVVDEINYKFLHKNKIIYFPSTWTHTFKNFKKIS
jgi:hypothetical protein